MHQDGQTQSPSVRWWLTRPGGEPLGPYSWPDLMKTVKASGGVGDWLACPEGQSEWRPLASDAALAASLNSPPRVTASYSGAPTSSQFPSAGNVQASPQFPTAAPPPSATPSKYSTILIHLGVIIPFVGWSIPLIIWLTKREDPIINDHGKEVVNWAIFVGITGFAGYAFSLLGMLIGHGISWVGAVMVFAGLASVFLVLIAAFVCAIIGAIKASEGRLFRYPTLFRLIK